MSQRNYLITNIHHFSVFIEITLLFGALHPIVNAIVLTLTTSQIRDAAFGKASNTVLRVFPFKSQQTGSQQKSVSKMHTEIGTRTMT